MGVLDKCCGNCKHFDDKEVSGYGLCDEPSMIYGIHRNYKACSLYEPSSSSDWTEITTDNVDEIDAVDPNRVVIATMIEGVVFSSVRADSDITLKSCSELGGYYYYVLPELKIE